MLELVALEKSGSTVALLRRSDALAIGADGTAQMERTDRANMPHLMLEPAIDRAAPIHNQCCEQDAREQRSNLRFENGRINPVTPAATNWEARLLFGLKRNDGGEIGDDELWNVLQTNEN